MEIEIKEGDGSEERLLPFVWLISLLYLCKSKHTLIHSSVLCLYEAINHLYISQIKSIAHQTAEKSFKIGHHWHTWSLLCSLSALRRRLESLRAWPRDRISTLILDPYIFFRNQISVRRNVSSKIWIPKSLLKPYLYLCLLYVIFTLVISIHFKRQEFWSGGGGSIGSILIDWIYPHIIYIWLDTGWCIGSCRSKSGHFSQII